ncbi:MAG: cytochrome c oxidase assembly factor Coa1 family protein [Pyrinomonadaceae bacterium]
MTDENPSTLRRILNSPAFLLTVVLALVACSVFASSIFFAVRRAVSAYRGVTRDFPQGVAAGASQAAAQAMESSEVYQEAVARAQTDADVREELGEPIKADAANTKGSISTQGLAGDANLIIPLTGSKKSGTLYATARREDGEWKFYTLAVKDDKWLIKLKK